MGASAPSAEGARRMLGATLEAEIVSRVAALTDQCDENDHRPVLVAGQDPPRSERHRRTIVESM